MNRIDWDEDALLRLKKAPFFIRGIARRKVEKVAIEQGVSKITLEFMERIKKQEMGR